MNRRAGAFAAMIAGLLIVLVSVWLDSPSSRAGVRLAQASYDWAQLWLPEAELKEAPVVIVYLDLESYLREKQDPREPWSRALHSQLIRRLTAAGAKAVVFDVIFDHGSTNSPADRELASAMRANGRVVLAAELARSSRETMQAEGIESLELSLPAPMFLNAAASWGVANVSLDDDFVVRREFNVKGDENFPSLLSGIANVAGLDKAQPPRAGWLRYYGRPLAIPHVGYSAALRPEEVNDEFFRGKTVLVGARPMVGSFLERKDEFRSPLASWSDRELFMPAVEVHATAWLNWIRGDTLQRLSAIGEVLILCTAAILAAGILFSLRPLAAAGMAAVMEGVFAGASVFALLRGHVWFPWLIPCAVQIPVAFAGSVTWQSLSWYRQRRRLQAQARADEEKIREQAALIDKAQDAILLETLAGEVIYANPSAEKLYGWSLAELRSRDVASQIMAPSAERGREARGIARETGEWLGEIEHMRRDGQILTVTSRCTLIRDETGRPKSLLFINTDMTEKKRLEMEFFRAQRIDGIGALAGGMAHDLNNALAPVLMGLQLLQKQNTDEESRRMLSLMELNTQRGAEMVKQVLLFSRGRNAGKERLSLGGLVHEMERIARQTFPRSIQVAALVPNDLWRVAGNATQLHQVLLNLCINARDAMANGGQLTLAVDNAELTAEEATQIPNGAPGRYVMLIVSDTGSGIAPEHLPRIFEPFFSTKPAGQGTGLGLSTIARIVNQHGGFVSVRSEKGIGTTFEVYLPAAEPVLPERPPQVEPAQMVRGSGQMILVVDDELSVREMLSIGLVAEGYRVTTAANGLEAIAAFENEVFGVDLVLMDTDMPGMNGEMAEAILKSRAPRVPILLMTGNAVGDGAEAKTLRLTKPFQLDELLRMMAHVMGLKSGRQDV